VPVLLAGGVVGAQTPAAKDPVVMQAMSAELTRAMSELGSAPVATDAKKPVETPKPYYLSYSVADAESVSISAQYGAITASNANHSRIADVQVRLGSPALDNTHGDHRTSALTTLPIPLSDDKDAIERTLWYGTNRGYGKALDALEKVKTEQQVRAKEEDQSADFSAEKAQQEVLPSLPKLNVDKAAWEQRLREITGVFREYPHIFYDTAIMQTSNETDYFVSSEGAHVATPNQVARLVVVARTRAADGMDLFRVETFEADNTGHLPAQSEVIAKTVALAKNLDDLRNAPITEPYNGPAILSGRRRCFFMRCWGIGWKGRGSAAMKRGRRLRSC